MSLNLSSSSKSQHFWKSFGQYMAPIPSAEGDKINWINYKTEVRFIKFIINVVNDTVIIGIELYNPDMTLQGEQFEQLLQLKKQFIGTCGVDWTWAKYVTDAHGKILCNITCTLFEANITNETNWPVIISFLKPRLILLDRFWSNYKFVFQF